MQTGALKTIRIERYFFGTILAFLMVFIAEFSGQKEIIFPEICALIIGAWISEIEPWSVNKRRIFILMTLSAVFGVLTVRYIPFPLIFKVCLCFAFTGLILTIFKTNFIPIISACILPVYLGTESVIYPVSVSLLTLIIIFIQYLMEKFHFRPKNNFSPCEFNFKYEFIRWLKLLTVFLIIAIIPFSAHQIYFLAPPLLVMFSEFSNSKSPARKRLKEIVFLMFFSSLIGCSIRFLNIYLNVPLFVCAVLSCIILFFLTYKLKINFPPSGAILLIPLILDEEFLLVFPVEVLLGAIVLSCASVLFFREEKNA